MTPGMKTRVWLQRLVWLVFGFVAIEAMYGTPDGALTLLLAGRYPAVGMVAGLVTAVAGILLAIRCARRIETTADRLGRAISQVSPRAWLVVVVVLGLAIRVGWLVLCPPDVQVSDHKTYSELAQKIVRGEPYFTAGTYSYWPPGYPYFLAAGYALLGTQAWVIGLANLLLYAGTTAVTWKLGKLMSGETAARIGTALVCIWPNLVLSVSLAKKELLLVLLVPLAMVLYLHARSASTRRGAALFALSSGAALGAASLTQPSLMLFPAVMLFFELISRRPVLEQFCRIVLLVTGMVLTIAPWTIRNYQVLHAFVPITTTGGDNFYSANNALATGGWIPKYERDLGQFDELTSNRMGYEWGKQWIRENPGRFMTLMLHKQLGLLSDDSEGAYWVLKAGRNIGDLRFVVLKGGSNIFWLVMVWLMFAALAAHWPPDTELPHPASLVMLSLLCVWTIDSVFQSGARHHMPLVPGLAILAGMLAQTRGGASRRGRGEPGIAHRQETST